MEICFVNEGKFLLGKIPRPRQPVRAVIYNERRGIRCEVNDDLVVKAMNPVVEGV